MKISGYVMIILMVGLGFAMVGSIVSDMQVQYPNTTVGTNFTEYDYQEQIASNHTLLQSLIEDMADEETGWILKVLIGVAAVPVAILTAMVVLIKSLGIGIIILTSIGSDIGIPSFVIAFAVTALTVLVVWGILSWWRRSKA